jgi:hypothetical protein
MAVLGQEETAVLEERACPRDFGLFYKNLQKTVKI